MKGSNDEIVRGASGPSHLDLVFLMVLVGFLALVGLASSITYFLRKPANPGFLDYPTIVAVHAISGAVYLTFAPLQFIGRIRSRHLDYHRWVGRGLVLIGLVVGLTALFIGLVIPFSGWSEAVVIALFGSLFIFCLFQGFRHIRAKRVDLRREWMLRAFTIAPRHRDATCDLHSGALDHG